MKWNGSNKRKGKGVGIISQRGAGLGFATLVIPSTLCTPGTTSKLPTTPVTASLRSVVSIGQMLYCAKPKGAITAHPIQRVDLKRNARHLPATSVYDVDLIGSDKR